MNLAGSLFAVLYREAADIGHSDYYSEGPSGDQTYDATRLDLHTETTGPHWSPVNLTEFAIVRDHDTQ